MYSTVVYVVEFQFFKTRFENIAGVNLSRQFNRLIARF